MPKEKEPNFWQSLANMVIQRGSAVVEFVRCPECGGNSFVGHYWTEVVECQHCHKKLPSSVPRRPEPGEVTLEHVTAAIQSLISCYGNTPVCRFSTESEWKTLDDHTKLLITQNITAACVAVLHQVDNLAVALATAGKVE